VRAKPHDRFGQFGRGIDDVLAVVEDQEKIGTPIARATASAEIAPPASLRPRTPAAAEGTRPASVSEASSTSQPPPW
jgi:hypothetical protein